MALIERWLVAGCIFNFSNYRFRWHYSSWEWRTTYSNFYFCERWECMDFNHIDDQKLNKAWIIETWQSFCSSQRQGCKVTRGRWCRKKKAHARPGDWLPKAPFENEWTWCSTPHGVFSPPSFVREGWKNLGVFISMRNIFSGRLGLKFVVNFGHSHCFLLMSFKLCTSGGYFMMIWFVYKGLENLKIKKQQFFLIFRTLMLREYFWS